MIETVGDLIHELAQQKANSKFFLSIWLEGRLCQIHLPVSTLRTEGQLVFLDASEHADMRDTMP
jgi:hypothetical protein